MDDEPTSSSARISLGRGPEGYRGGGKSSVTPAPSALIRISLRHTGVATRLVLVSAPRSHSSWPTSGSAWEECALLAALPVVRFSVREGCSCRLSRTFVPSVG
jgi:hypothetical protein